MKKINSCYIFNDECIYSSLEIFTTEEISKTLTQESLETYNNKFSTCVYQKTRIAMYKTENSVLYIETNDPDLVKSNKTALTHFQTILEISKSLIFFREDVKKQTEKEINNIIHNLRTFNARSLQELEAILPLNKLDAGINNNNHAKIESHMQKEISKTTTALIKCYKNISLISNEISIFEIKDFTQLKKNQHKIHKLVMSTLYPYHIDFYEKFIKVSVQKSDLKVYAHYETLVSALHLFFQNALKYTKPNTDIKIDFNQENHKTFINISMVSLEITENEIKQLHIENFRGNMAKKTYKAGNGLGWGIMLKYLNANGGNIDIHPNYESLSQLSKDDIRYQENHFKIELPNSSNIIQ